MNRNTAAYYFHRLRQLICQAVKDAAPVFGEIEVDESCFGGSRKGKVAMELLAKCLYLVFLKRNGRVYTKVIPDIQSTTLMRIIE